MKKLKFMGVKLSGNWGLSAKLTAAYSLLILLVAGILTINLYLHLRRVQRQAMRDRLLDLVSLAAPQIDSDYHSLIVNDSDRQQPYYTILQQRLQAFQTATKGIKEIYTLRQQPNGNIVYVIDYSLPPNPSANVGDNLTKLTPLLKGGLNSIPGPIVEENLLQNQAGNTVLYGYAPIIDAMGRREGVLAIELDASAILEREIQARNLAIITFLVTLPLAIIIGWWLARKLTSPIAELVVIAEAIAQGKLDQTVKVYSKDEVGSLAKAFNYMSHQLKESFDTLEAKVTQRTAELAHANQEISELNQRLKAENIRMSAELEVTRQLQQMILPKSEELSQISELDIAGFMEPAEEVGGDYYDIIRQNDRIKISIGDVTGHGLESGVLMIMAQTALRTLLIHNETNIEKILNTINHTIYENLQRMNSNKYLSFSLLDYYNGSLILSGQHEEIIIVRGDSDNQPIVERIDTEYLGFPLGLESDISHFFASTKIQLQSGDMVVLYTDGITEAENLKKEPYGLQRLIDIVKENWQFTANEIRQLAIADLRNYIGTQKVYDDITLVVIKRNY
ncbi:stage II sporulation protein E [Oscillatoriales cyanobacterium USR001]|nr:stage II sporulation protein E [Oscillatoriales cyanobacterium USR001]